MSSDHAGANADDLAVPLPATLTRLKQQVQFSGWLQYALPLAMAAGFALAAGLAALIGSNAVRILLLVLTGLALLRFVFELLVIKFRLVALPEPEPKRIDGNALSVIAARHSCRSFQDRPFSDAHNALIKSSVARETAPDCAEAFAQGTVRVERVRARLNVWPAVNAQEFLVVLGPVPYSRAAVIEAGRAVQSVVLDLTAAGIATCWIGPGADQSSVEAALGDRFDPSTDHVLCVVALGYASRYWPWLTRAMAPITKRRKPAMDLIFEDVPGLPAPLKDPAYTAYKPAIEALRQAPSSYNSQTTRLILSRKDKSLRLARFCATDDSRYYAPLALGIWAANWTRACQALDLPGRFTLQDKPMPLALGLVRDLDWKPLPRRRDLT